MAWVGKIGLAGASPRDIKLSRWSHLVRLVRFWGEGYEDLEGCRSCRGEVWLVAGGRSLVGWCL